MERTVKNTQFDNLVNYESRLSSNSSWQIADNQTSVDPSAISTLSKNNQIVDYSLLAPVEKTVQESEQAESL